MVELKTLKDLDLNYEDIWDLNKGSPEEILKAEAVKWYKDLHRGFKNGIEISVAARWIKHFFNITEEDL